METIKSKAEFERVFSHGKRANDSLLRIRVAATNEGDRSKVAFVAPKRLGNAVFRNRCKRVLREAARACRLPADGYDVILFATKDTYASSPELVAKALGRMLDRTGVRDGQ